jgi:hypothetical protein
VVEFEIRKSITLVQAVEFRDEASSRLQPEAALKEAGRRTERAHERASATGFDAQQIKIKVRDRIVVVVENREAVEVCDDRLARVEMESKRSGTAPTHA